MSYIYLVDPGLKVLKKVKSVSLSSVGIKERRDLERWVVAEPGLLGEPLLVVTTEFHRFDRSAKRLDVLALDAQGKLAVVELKLDATGSFADQQAIRYAAFCSTMTMAGLVEEYARFHDVSTEDAEQRVRAFLEVDELPELDDRPRIMLAAGTMDDTELTATALWLRKFGLDISCIELTPYQMPETDRLALVPKVVIPPPLERDYMISVSRKEAAQEEQQTRQGAHAQFWRALADSFNAMKTQFAAPGGTRGYYKQIAVGDPNVHYEWIIRRRPQQVDVALHFENRDPAPNRQLVGIIQEHQEEIAKGTDWTFDAGKWTETSTHARFVFPYEGQVPSTSMVPELAEAMRVLIARTWPLMQPHIGAK